MLLDHSQLQFDAAVAGGKALLETAAPLLRPEEQQTFFEKARRICLAMLEAYHQQALREELRINPSRN